MADSTASFEADAIGGAPKGWTATKTAKGDSKMDGSTVPWIRIHDGS